MYKHRSTESATILYCLFVDVDGNDDNDHFMLWYKRTSVLRKVENVYTHTTFYIKDTHKSETGAGNHFN